jgi:alpha-L-arabinofuranosidase
MYAPHQDATLLPLHAESEPLGGGSGLPRVSASASRDDAGRIHVSLVNLHPREPTEVRCEIRGAGGTRAALLPAVPP